MDQPTTFPIARPDRADIQPEFDAMPERMRAQMAAKAQPVPTDWPREAQERLRSLQAQYNGEAQPYERTLYRPAILDKGTA